MAEDSVPGSERRGPLVTFTDFGAGSAYVGQLHLTLARCAPGIPVIELVSDAPRFRPRSAAYLLAGLIDELARDTVVLAVVDPGVGTGRAPLVVRIAGRWCVGPDNGLLDVAAQWGERYGAWQIIWRPPRLSASFHGRDLFAPIAARLALGAHPDRGDWARSVMWQPTLPPALREVVYVDGYGNAMIGIRAREVPPGATLRCRGRQFPSARTFADVPSGAPMWYENSSGLAELACNQGHAADRFGIRIGDAVDW